MNISFDRPVVTAESCGALPVPCLKTILPAVALGSLADFHAKKRVLRHYEGGWVWDIFAKKDHDND